MAFWVHGRDATTGEPGSMLSSANTPEGAREQAAKQGLVAETIQIEKSPVRDRVPLNVFGPRVPKWLRFKVVGFVLFVAAIVAGYSVAHSGDIAFTYVTAIGIMGQLYFVAFACWMAGCIFQSRTWKNFKLGCGMGIVMVVVALFSVIAVVPK